jgi:hypothetical protein
MWSRSTAGFWADNRAKIAENGSVMSTGASFGLDSSLAELFSLPG